MAARSCTPYSAAEMSDAAFQSDRDVVAHDLAKLKSLLEQKESSVVRVDLGSRG